ncbi:MAG: hypothetical protein AB7E05_10035 [Sphingobium sp.]
MSEDTETRHELVRRLFCLLTLASEEAAMLAVKGQSPHPDLLRARTLAAALHIVGERIEIVSQAIGELTRDIP